MDLLTAAAYFFLDSSDESDEEQIVSESEDTNIAEADDNTHTVEVEGINKQSKQNKNPLQTKSLNLCT